MDFKKKRKKDPISKHLYVSNAWEKLPCMLVLIKIFNMSVIGSALTS